MAAVGSDRVLIGAPLDSTSASDSGRAYLFSTNGTLLATINNPTPGGGEEFAIAVAGFGSDRLLIGADSDNPNQTGGAYLFSTNGTLLTAFTHPSIGWGSWFGYSLAALGTDRVLIGSFQMDGSGTNYGRAFVFNTNGTLLTTITNPTPAAGDWFGYAVAALGNKHVVIGAPQDDVGATNAGAVHVLNLDDIASASVISLEEALDTVGTLNWTTTNALNWSGQADVTHDGVDAAASPTLTNGNSSAMFQTIVTGPGTISFWWKVSSETNSDRLNFADNATHLMAIHVEKKERTGGREGPQSDSPAYARAPSAAPPAKIVPGSIKFNSAVLHWW